MATFTNQATMTYNGRTAVSNITVGELVQNLTAAKTAVLPTYEADGRVTYLVSLVNSGATALSDLTVTDDMGGYTFNGGTVYPLAYTAGSVRYYRNGVPQAAPAVTAGPPLVISGISVPAGGSAVIAYEASVTAYAPLDTAGSVTNTVSITGTGIADAVTAAETTTPAAVPRLSIRKSLSPTSVTESGQLTYTFTVENSGNTAAEASASVVISDTFDPQLSGLTVTLNGAALASPAQYTYDTGSGLFATTAGTVTVPAATFTQDAATGAYSVTPGTAVLTVSGTV